MSNCRRTSVVEVISVRSNSDKITPLQLLQSKTDEPLPRLNSKLELNASIASVESLNFEHPVLDSQQGTVVEISNQQDHERTLPRFRGKYDHRRMSNGDLLEVRSLTIPNTGLHMNMDENNVLNSQRNSTVEILNTEDLIEPTDDSIHVRNYSTSSYEVNVSTEVTSPNPVLQIPTHISSSLMNINITSLHEPLENYEIPKELIIYHSSKTEHISLEDHKINEMNNKFSEDKIMSKGISKVVEDTKAKEAEQPEIILHIASPEVTQSNAHNPIDFDNHIFPRKITLPCEPSIQISSQVQENKTGKICMSSKEQPASSFQYQTSDNTSSNSNDVVPDVNFHSKRKESGVGIIQSQVNKNTDNLTSSIEPITGDQQDHIVDIIPMIRRESTTENYNTVQTEQSSSLLYSPPSVVTDFPKANETIHTDDCISPLDLVLCHFKPTVNVTSHAPNVTTSDNDVTLEEVQESLLQGSSVTDDQIRQAVNVISHAHSLTASDNNVTFEEMQERLSQPSSVTDDHARQEVMVISHADSLTASDNNVTFEEMQEHLSQSSSVTDDHTRQEACISHAQNETVSNKDVILEEIQGNLSQRSSVTDDHNHIQVTSHAQKINASDQDVTLEEIQGSLLQRSSVSDYHIHINDGTNIDNYISPIDLTTTQMEQVGNEINFENHIQTRKMDSSNEQINMSKLSQLTIAKTQIQNITPEINSVTTLEPKIVSQFNSTDSKISETDKTVAIENCILTNKQHVYSSQLSPAVQNTSAHSDMATHIITEISSMHLVTAGSFKPSIKKGLQVLDISPIDKAVTHFNYNISKKEQPSNEFQIHSTIIETNAHNHGELPINDEISLVHKINISEPKSNLKMNTVRQPAIYTENGVSSETLIIDQFKPSVVENISKMGNDILAEEQQVSISQFSPSTAIPSHPQTVVSITSNACLVEPENISNFKPTMTNLPTRIDSTVSKEGKSPQVLQFLSHIEHIGSEEDMVSQFSPCVVDKQIVIQEDPSTINHIALRKQSSNESATLDSSIENRTISQTEPLSVTNDQLKSTTQIEVQVVDDATAGNISLKEEQPFLSQFTPTVVNVPIQFKEGAPTEDNASLHKKNSNAYQFSPTGVNTSAQFKEFDPKCDIPSEGRASLSQPMSTVTTVVHIQETKNTKNHLSDEAQSSNISHFSPSVINITNVQVPKPKESLITLRKFKPTIEIITHVTEISSTNKNMEGK